MLGIRGKDLSVLGLLTSENTTFWFGEFRIVVFIDFFGLGGVLFSGLFGIINAVGSIDFFFWDVGAF